MPKKENLQLVFAYVISAVAEHFSVSNPVSIATSALTCLRAFRFCGWDRDLHSDGLLPMAFILPDVSPSCEALDEQNLYTLRSGGLAPLTLTLTDIKELSTEKGYICTRWPEAVLQLDAYLPLLAALIGFNHPVVVSYQAGLQEFHKNAVAIESVLSDQKLVQLCLSTTFMYE